MSGVIATIALLLPFALSAQRPPTPTAACSMALPADSGDDVALARQLIVVGEACGDQSVLSQALDRLGTELFRRGGSAQAWYLAARARFALARFGAVARTGPRLVAGMSYAQGALAALREALDRDSAYAPAAVLLANIELRRLGRVDDDADAALIRRASGAGTDAPLLLVRAHRELEWQQWDSVLAVTDRVVAAGGDTALATLERARALLMLGRLQDGEAAWLDGLAVAHSDSAVAEYRRDLGWIATDAELASFDSLIRQNSTSADSIAHRRWAAAFWARRGAQDFRPPAERMAEHEERIRFALREFALRENHRDYNRAMPFHSDQQLVDDRGVVYIRHGPPSRVIESGREGINSCAVYSWIYDAGPDRGLIVHFRPFFTLLISPRRFCTYADFKMVPGGVWIDANAPRLARYDTLYAHWLDETRPIERQRLERAVVAEDVDRLTLAVTTDADPLHFDRDLHAVVRSYGLSDPSRILVAFSLAPDGLGRINHGGPAIPLRLRLAALPGQGPAVTLDTTILYDASRPRRPDQWLVGYVELPAPAGRYEVRAMATGADPVAGSFRLQPAVEVPATMMGEPVVSALVLGSAMSELRWPTAVGDFPLSPLDGYAEGSDVEIFLEVHGLPPNARIVVGLTLASLSSPKREAVQLRSIEQALGATLIVRRSLSLAGVQPGLYMLKVEVRLPDGRVASREQKLGVGK